MKSYWKGRDKSKLLQKKKRRDWGWIGLTLRKPATNTTRQALSWNPQGKRKVGRPRQTWRRSLEEELRQSELGGVSWGGPVKIVCDGGVLLRPYVPLGIKRHKSRKSSNNLLLDTCENKIPNHFEVLRRA